MNTTDLIDPEQSNPILTAAQEASARRDGHQTCPTCHGKKKVRVEAYELRKGQKKALPVLTIECVTCNGKGYLTAAEADRKLHEDGMWCSCEDPSGSDFHPDAGGMKHHYTCSDCGKITQIG